MPSDRRRVSSGGPWEERYAYSRAIAVGNDCWVAGTTDAGSDGRSLHPGDAGAQAREILVRVGRALQEAGFSLDDTVRVRVHVTDPGHIAAVGEVLGDVFVRARPAATAVVVAGLIEPSLLVEIEVDARRG